MLLIHSRLVIYFRLVLLLALKIFVLACKYKKPLTLTQSITNELLILNKINFEEFEMNPKANHDSHVYCCYLLKCLNQEWENYIYIGFTNNPVRRIKQHNGLLENGAKKTRWKRPWEMVVFVYGFPTKHSALQFEWHWQNPNSSRILKHKFKKNQNSVKKKFEVLVEMLNINPWRQYPLHLNFTKQAFKDDWDQFLHIKDHYLSHIPAYMNIYVRPLYVLTYFLTKGSQQKESANANENEKTDINDGSNDTSLVLSENASFILHPSDQDILTRHCWASRAMLPKIVFCHCCCLTVSLTDLKQSILSPLKHTSEVDRTSDVAITTHSQPSLHISLLQNRLTKCPKCFGFLHILCLAKAHVSNELKKRENQKKKEDFDETFDRSNLLPKIMSCPKCGNLSHWAEFIANIVKLSQATFDGDDDNDNDKNNSTVIDIDFDDDDSDDDYEGGKEDDDNDDNDKNANHSHKAKANEIGENDCQYSVDHNDYHCPDILTSRSMAGLESVQRHEFVDTCKKHSPNSGVNASSVKLNLSNVYKNLSNDDDNDITISDSDHSPKQTLPILDSFDIVSSTIRNEKDDNGLDDSMEMTFQERLLAKQKSCQNTTNPDGL
ncbi:hypothetical protein RFI_14976 [Reticulomyxa filosa]|uniref:Structure-specific endonuclease subunit SLX1 homolog n=1 Tax=Reticulomyxa filosa TaxID=46433 RepID=X6N8Z0_RETFI|nr:hypothetical protein RFI_14976 [Reticulomyxa filosa]|eukprot:ETO22224.1 hypothetical protein RFI_14976 [Reticulomyxa filosa]